MDEYMSRRGVWYLTCRNSPEEIGRARRWTRDMLHDQPLADDAELIVSELGTNALLHSASGQQTGTFRISLALRADALSISVTDQGSPTTPHIERPSAEATHGRGLGMVATLAHVEITGDHHGRTVTAQLPMPRQGGPTVTVPAVPQMHHGYRCECRIQSPTTGDTPTLTAAFGTTDAEEAIRWIRRYVTTLAAAVEAKTRQQVAQWLSTDHAKAVDDLQRGQLCTFATDYADMHLEWTARPVIFLPLLPPPGKPVISYAPMCAHADRTTEFCLGSGDA